MFSNRHLLRNKWRKHMRKGERRNQIITVITDYVIHNLRQFLLIFIIFLIGIVLGVSYVNKLEGDSQTQVQNYIQNFIDVLKQGNARIDRMSLAKQNLMENLGLVLLLWFAGSTVIGMPVVLGVILYKGFSLGYSVAAVIASLGIQKGSIFALSSIFLQNIIFIPCLLFLGVSGMKLYQAILKDHRKENIKFEIYKHSMMSLILAGISSIGTLIEVYLSTSIFLLTIPLY